MIPQNEMTALIIAAQEGHVEVANTLVQAGADVNSHDMVSQ